ncbi:uncharacterized protein LOC142592761 [Dermacentor variabilis]|uniref:uncharacterized protein LOC142592761 n=1 Tax=Dermacentor variabilis TaxID=34621 RepID=UPI003F5B0A1E
MPTGAKEPFRGEAGPRREEAGGPQEAARPVMTTTSEKTTAVAETTTTTTAKPRDVPGRILCFAKVHNDLDSLKKLCSQLVLIVKFEPTEVRGKGDEVSLTPIKKSFGQKLVIGTKMEENQELSFYEGVVKNRKWNLTASHALTEVYLKKETAQKLKDIARILKTVHILALHNTSDIAATLDATSSMPGLEVITKMDCEALAWNDNNLLNYINAVKRQTTLSVAISLSAAIWGHKNSDGEKDKFCARQDLTGSVMTCMESSVWQECKKAFTVVLVDNATIRALVNYGKLKKINTFAIFSAHYISWTAALNRQFQLLNFTLPAVPEKNGLPPSIPPRQPDLDESPALRAVRESSMTDSCAESAVSGMSLEADEQTDETGQMERSTEAPGETAPSNPSELRTPNIVQTTSEKEKLQ